ncbi:MAG: hypothetical protein LBE31_11555 [Deltaproteobacteria bacterium]|jgi:hypothetical protein|nr:hypothetical protein [Deltaproteobacteria bacterium]
MKKSLPSIDRKAVRLTSLANRFSKVGLDDFAKPLDAGLKFSAFIDSLPSILAASDLRKAALAIAKAVNNGRTVMLAMGGHPIKVGLGPLIISLLEKGVFSSISTNGSVMVHDTEVALIGATSEDVAVGLGTGEFGVTGETGELINKAAAKAAETGQGLGRSLGSI